MSRNLIDQVFGKWTIITSAEKYAGGQARWLCRCSGCLKEVIVSESSLITGDSTGCKQCRNLTKNNLIGQVFRKLTVIEKYIKSKSNRSQWKCLCICKREIITTGQRLKNGKVSGCKSCSQISIDQIVKIGNRYGSWQVVNLSNKKEYGTGLFYCCKCDCGSVDLIEGKQLRTKRSLRCKKCTSIKYLKVHSKFQDLVTKCIEERLPNIKMILECTFDRKLINPRSGHCLKVDIFIPKLALAIECDGDQHKNKNHIFNKLRPSNHISTEESDKIKEIFLKENNYKLLRIDYTKSIESINIQLDKVLDKNERIE